MNYPACLVALMNGQNQIEINNLGGETWVSPFDGTVLPGANIVCSLAAAQQQLDKITSDCGLQFQPPVLPKYGQFNYLAIDPEILGTEVVFGTGPNDVNIYTAVDTAGVVRGNIQELIVQQNFTGKGGKWVFDVEFGSPVKQLRFKG
jgi:hypothetical protein